MKVITFGASSSSTSINQKLAAFTASLIEGADVELLDINDFEMPIFSEDREKELGQPEQARAFFKKITDADALVISFAEHNGSYSAAFKNLFDWTSRIETKVFQGKPTVMLATSPGPGGGSNVLATAQGSASFYGADLRGTLSVPSFYDNFDVESGRVSNQALSQDLATLVKRLS